jgi:hypothetical protein
MMIGGGGGMISGQTLGVFPEIMLKQQDNDRA